MTPILILEIESTGQRFTLPPDRSAVLGRTEGADLVIPNDTVARRHARFTCTEGAWTVEDLGSHCGIFVNDETIGSTATSLREGDRVRIGHVILLVRFVFAAGSSGDLL
jgi:two-component system, NtrC family, response regulator AtoC